MGPKSKAKLKPAAELARVRMPPVLHDWGNRWAKEHPNATWKNYQGRGNGQNGKSSPPTNAYLTIEKLFQTHYLAPPDTNWQSCGPEYKKLISQLMGKKCQGKEKILKNAKNTEDKRCGRMHHACLRASHPG
jgi:hypothetical protein